jgi:stage V sporulation protein B
LPKQQKTQSLINGAIVLTLAMVAVKIIGALFKIPLGDTLGTEGRGLFDGVYQLYAPIFAISMAGLPVAVARMVSESVALKRFREARAVLKISQRIFMIAGIVGTVLLVALAYPYIKVSGQSEQILPGIFMIAPAVFLCCMMSSYRGYYEGLRNMNPTAASQFIEALGKLVVGLVLAKGVINYALAQFEGGSREVFGVAVENATDARLAAIPWASAAAILGVTIGSIVSLLYLMLRHKLRGDGITRLDLEISPEAKDPKVITRELLALALPVVASALILNLSNLIDTMTINRMLRRALETDYATVWAMHKGALEAAIASGNLDLNLPDAGAINEKIATYLWGAYNMGIDFRNLVPTIVSSFGISALPVLAAAWAVKNRNEVRRSVNSVLRLCLLIAMPAGFGMAVLAEPLLTILYGGGNAADGISVSAPVLQAFGFSTALLALSAPITNMLQGIGRTDIPVKTMALCAAVKFVCNLALIGLPGLNIYGSIIGTVIFYVLDVALNLYFLIKITGVKVAWGSVLMKPLFCGALCAGAAWATYGITLRGMAPLVDKILPLLQKISLFQEGHKGARIAEMFVSANTFSVLASVLLAALIYVISLLLTKAITEDDIIGLPNGEKIAKVLAKRGLLG